MRYERTIDMPMSTEGSGSDIWHCFFFNIHCSIDSKTPIMVFETTELMVRTKF